MSNEPTGGGKHKFSLFMDSRLYERFSDHARSRGGLRIQEYVQRAVEAGAPVVLGEAHHPKPHAPASVPESKWHRMLQAILDSGNRKAITAVQSNLAVFFDYIGGEKPD